jgi:ring-1,2-phenylacetyl-CoA epoxidase subunit PaaC
MADDKLRKQLAACLLGLADDELFLGHRNSEWCGHAPILEEDIAFANLALDEIGHAALWYSLVAQLTGENPETYPDRLVYFREAGEFQNAALVELPNGDWAFTILRQYLFDVGETVRLERLAQSSFAPLAEIAARIQKEEIYHRRHSQAWVKRLGLGTEESHLRMQNALNLAWPYTAQLFASPDGVAALAEAGWTPAGFEVRSAWLAQVLPLLQMCGLDPPEAPAIDWTRGEHTPHIKVLLAEMQCVARDEPEAEW